MFRQVAQARSYLLGNKLEQFIFNGNEVQFSTNQNLLQIWFCIYKQVKINKFV